MQNIIIGFFDLLGELLDSLLPHMSSNGITQITDAVQFFINLISASNYLFPVTTAFTITGIVMGYKVFMFGWWIVSKVIDLIRG
jgi:hypothetical protein